MCGRMSHVLASTRSGIAFCSLFLFVGGSFVLAGIAGYLVLGIIGVPLAIGYSSWAWKRAELFPISAESAASSRRGSLIVNVLAVFGVFWS